MSSPQIKSPVRRARTLLHGWEELAAREPTAPALIEAAQNRVFTRAALDDLAQTWANHIPAETALKGARVAFALPNGASWISVFLGLLRRGAVPVPLDASEPIAAQRELARHAGAAYLWTGDILESLGPDQPRPTRGICLIKLTSGTTGTPRPLLFTDAQMLADARQICTTMEIGPEDINLAIVPFGHSYGLGNLLIPLLAHGTAALCVSAPLPHAIAADILRWQPTIFPAVPALLRVLTLSDLPADTFAGVRAIISAGSPLSPDVAQAFYQKYHHVIHGFYGSSETGGITYDRSGEATLAGRSVGTPMDGVTLTFFPEEQRFEVESAAVFTRGNRRRNRAGNGIFSPADRGELNASGELVLLGRAGRMMKIAGRRIDLSELEQTLKQLPGIRDAIVVPHPQRPEELAAALATPLSLEETRALLRRELAAWKLPRRLLVFPEFSVTSRGKTDTRWVREQLGER